MKQPHIPTSEERPVDEAQPVRMPKRQKPESTRRDLTDGNSRAQGVGFRIYDGERINVSMGQMEPGLWHEHSRDRVRLVIKFNDADARIETVRGIIHEEFVWVFDSYSLCIIPPETESRIDWERRAELIVLDIDPSEFGIHKDEITHVIFQSFSYLMRSDACLSLLAQAMLILCRQLTPPTPKIVEGTGIALASRIMELAHSFSNGSKAIRLGLLNKKGRKVLKYIDKQIKLRKKISVEELAKIADLTTDHFARQFKVTYEMSPLQYVLKRTMNMVYNLLQTGNYNVTQAGEKFGFCDLSHLNRCFRKFHHCSPRQVLRTALPGDSYQRRKDASMGLAGREV
jgi:AraC-like DNA-binding protein